jgi:hypothetical protein
MNKTHVPDFPITSHQYHNYQVALHFCAIRNVGQSVGSSVGMSTGRSVGSSVRSKNMVGFFPVTPEKCELDLGNHKHDELYVIQSLNMNHTYLMLIIPFYHKILQKTPLKYEKHICTCSKSV